jgi:hypothetical protein
MLCAPEMRKLRVADIRHGFLTDLTTSSNSHWTYSVFTERPEKALADTSVRSGQLVSTLHHGRDA